MISVQVFGNVGSEPEMSTTNSGTNILKFSVASNEGSGDRKTTTWAKVSAFGKLGETCKPLVAKGARVLVVGTARLEEWAGRDNQKRVDLVVEAREIKIVDYPERDQAQAAPAAQQQQQRQAPPQYHPPGTSPGAGATHVLANGAWQPLAPPAPPPPPAAPQYAPPPANGYAPPPPPPAAAPVRPAPF
jgi:single-strand DNA-binding protein